MPLKNGKREKGSSARLFHLDFSSFPRGGAATATATAALLSSILFYSSQEGGSSW